MITAKMNILPLTTINRASLWFCKRTYFLHNEVFAATKTKMPFANATDCNFIYQIYLFSFADIPVVRRQKKLPFMMLPKRQTHWFITMNCVLKADTAINKKQGNAFLMPLIKWIIVLIILPAIRSII